MCPGCDHQEGLILTLKQEWPSENSRAVTPSFFLHALHGGGAESHLVRIMKRLAGLEAHPTAVDRAAGGAVRGPFAARHFSRIAARFPESRLHLGCAFLHPSSERENVGDGRPRLPGAGFSGARHQCGLARTAAVEASPCCGHAPKQPSGYAREFEASVEYASLGHPQSLCGQCRRYFPIPKASKTGSSSFCQPTWGRLR